MLLIKVTNNWNHQLLKSLKIKFTSGWRYYLFKLPLIEDWSCQQIKIASTLVIIKCSCSLLKLKLKQWNLN